MSHISLESIGGIVVFIIIALAYASNGSGEALSLKAARKLRSELDDSVTVQEYFAAGHFKRAFGMKRSAGERNRARVLDWLSGHKSYTLADLVAAALYMQDGPHAGKLIVGPDAHGRMTPAIARSTKISELNAMAYDAWREAVMPAIIENLKRADIDNRAY